MPDASEGQSAPVIAVDPGREKCGVAVVSSESAILERRVPALTDLGCELIRLCGQYRPRAVAVGDRTGHETVTDLLSQAAFEVPVHLVDEHHSTLEARQLYFEENPPRGWRRLLPLSLQIPPVPVDDYAAVVLARRFLESGLAEAGSRD